MCAIAGILNFDSDRPVETQILLRMRDTMVHRGPDDQGVYTDGPAGLAARRLSIIDLVTGNQPVHNEDRTVWAVLNGEIYNFKEVRADLLKRGHRFHTNGDTEVLVHGFEEFGPDCVRALKGMFAFAVWDVRKKTLFLARDRMGEKPLYYHAGNHEFVFGSELKSLLQHPSTPRELDPSSLTKYLTYQFVPAPHTIFRGVRKLEPGHSLLVKAGSPHEVIPHQYWDIPHTSRALIERPYSCGPQAVGAVYDRPSLLVEKLRKAVKSQLVSDVPVGVLMSGGLDSTLVATLAAQEVPKLKTFTMSFDEPSYDESRNAALVADRIGAEHHVEVCHSRAIRELIPRIAGFMDEPFADASILPAYMLSKFTAKSVKVALGGDGGDELFAGYPTFQALRLRSVFKHLPSPVRAMVAAGVNALPVSHEYVSLDFKLKQFLRGIGGTPESGFFVWMGAFTDAEKQTLLARELRTNTFEDLTRLIASIGSRDEIQNCLYLCAKLYLQDGVLVKVDRASMANSLEVRAPFLDHEFVEFAAGIPLARKMTLFRTKIILREAAKGLLPPEILAQRRKRGFAAPIGKWILGDLKDCFREYLEPGRLKRDGVFNPVYVQQLLSEHLTRRRNNWKLLWTLLVFQLWKERWHTSGPVL